MYKGNLGQILLIIQRLKQALSDMGREYSAAGDYFLSMSGEIDKISHSFKKIDFFCKLNIESLEKLIEILKNHLEGENDLIIKSDLSTLINDLEKELADKLKNIN